MFLLRKILFFYNFPLKKVLSTPFCIETPIAAINPTPAETEKYVCVKNNAKIPPIIVTGIGDIATKTYLFSLKIE